MKLLTAIAVLFALVVPTADADVVVECSSTINICAAINVDPNHICYLPGTSLASEDICELPIGVVDVRFNPPRVMPAPWTITFMYSVLPVDGPPRGFVAVPGNRATIAAGATGGVVPIQLLAGSPLAEERAVVQIYWGSGRFPHTDVLIVG